MTPTYEALGLVVADMTRAVEFYRLLGLTFTDSGDHAECTLPGGTRLMLDTESSIRQFTPDWTRPGGDPRVSLAFRLDTPAAVDALFEQLTAAGHRGTRPPWDAFWGHRYASLLDPDGNGVDLFAELPGARA